ncbi:MAG TPA: DHA2 family efflux MFS transporter permease subunit [Steroidobacteraceae bacterium]|nr:DHA2 family efflux MFS transporter permease subunit [Steroidobacteraceae bacterium]
MSAVADTIPGAAREAPHRGLITLSVMLASIMQALDNTIANVALPRIQGTLSATQDQMSWVLTSYIVAAAIMTPLAGWLAGRFGRRKIFLYSILGFTIASALCGLAQTLPQIVLARLAQGLSGAALIPMSQATLLDINPPERHGRAMTVWVMGVTIGPILGPALGGWLTEQYSWRWVFYINVPFGILAFFGVLTFMKETVKRATRFDFFGFASLALAVGSLQLMLDRGQSNDWFSNIETWIEAGICAVSTYLFAIHVLTTRKVPFISPALFKDRNFLTGNLFIFLIGVVLFATLALLPPLLQNLLGYPVVLTGLVTAPRGIGTLIAMAIVGRLATRIDGRYVMAFGLTLTAVSLWWMTNFYLQMDSNEVVWSGLLQGFGTGCVFAPLSTIAFSTLAPHLRNEGTAFFSLMRNLGSSVGISAVTTLLVRNTQIMHSRLAEHVTPFSDGLTPSLSPGVPAAEHLAQLNAVVTQQAAMIAYNNDFKLMLILTVIAIPLVALLRAPPTVARAAQPAIVE